MGLLTSCINVKSIISKGKKSLTSALDTALESENKGLTKALLLGDLELVTEAIESGADINRFGLKDSPLWYSIREGQNCIPAYLLSKGADPNFVDEKDMSILMYTVGANAPYGITYSNAQFNKSYKTLLADKRTNINLKGRLGYTALDYACRDSGHLDKVNYLISHGAIITASTMKCAMDGFSKGFCDASVVRLILDSLIKKDIPSGLDPELEAAILGDSSKLLSLYNKGKIKKQNMQMVQFLTAAFGDANTLKTLTASDVDLNTLFHENTLLSTASKYGNLETVKYLVSQNVNLEATAGTRNNYTALTMAISCNRLDIAQYLQKSGAIFQIFNTTEQNPLEFACENGNLDMIKWILDSGFPMKTGQDASAMIYAARNNKIDVLKYFLDVKKFDINAEDNMGYTTLEGATYSASLDTIKFLVENGAKVNGDKNQYGLPLPIAAMCNRVDVAKYLIEKGADVNLAGTRDGSKDSRPLTKAIQSGYFEMIKLLVDNGASVDYKEGWSTGRDTPLDMAKAEGSKRILEYIEAAKRSK